MTEQELKKLYPLGLKICLFGGPFILATIVIEWIFINKDYVIPTTFAWLVTMISMWGCFIFIGLRRKN